MSAPTPSPAFVFTFGLGSPLAHYYVEIAAPDESSARCLMTSLFSSHWANVYPRDAFNGRFAHCGLTRLHVNFGADVRLGTNHARVPVDIATEALKAMPQIVVAELV